MKYLRAARAVVYCASLAAFALGQSQSISPSSPSSPSSPNPSLERRIEVLIRAQFSVPPQDEIILGTRRKSEVEGYDTLPVTFSYAGKHTSVDFLVSEDNSTLARLEKFAISTNPILSIDTSNRPVRGYPSAKVEIVNFDDLQCPYCAMLNNEILPATLKHYQELVKVIYKDYPLPGHPWARHAAIDANCLATQSTSAYWSYVDYVHSHEHEINGSTSNPARSFLDLDNIADTFGTQNRVDSGQLSMCMKRQDETVINQSLKVGAALGVDGTPQVFVDGERLPSGARPIEELWPAIDRALRAKGIEPPGKSPQAQTP